jgi:hypothetical protein
MRRQGPNPSGNLLGDNGPRQVTDEGSLKLDSYQEIQRGEQLTKVDIDFVKESDLPKGESINESNGLFQEHQTKSAPQNGKYKNKLD